MGLIHLRAKIPGLGLGKAKSCQILEHESYPWKEFHYTTLVMMSNLKYTDMRLKKYRKN